MIIPAILEQTVDAVIEKIETLKGIAPLVQIDIADGAFVNTTTVSVAELLADGRLCEYVKQGLAVEFHLMVAQPLAYMGACQQIGAMRVFWHYEAAPDTVGMIAALRPYGFKKGLAVNPQTPLEEIMTKCSCVDAVLLLGVEPGRQGQSFIPATVGRVRQLRERQPQLPVVVDGGVNEQNAAELFAVGASELVVGNAIFSAPDPIVAYRVFDTAWVV